MRVSNLQRAAINFGINKGMPKAMLSINAENEKTLKIYIGEDFLYKKAFYIHLTFSIQ